MKERLVHLMTLYLVIMAFSLIGMYVGPATLRGDVVWGLVKAQVFPSAIVGAILLASGILMVRDKVMNWKSRNHS